MNKRVLVFCDFYLPGYRAGGGMRTVVNLVDRFYERFDFFIVTRNYDSPADTTPYTNVKTGEWNDVGHARVHYLYATDITSGKCAALVEEAAPDVVYLNSMFATTCVKFLMARVSGALPPVPVILAPCGELSRRALSIKPLKKKAYLTYAKARRSFDGVIWKASSESERAEIQAVFGNNVEVMVAPDLAPAAILPDLSAEMKPAKRMGEARFVSLSRVVSIKNIKFFLELLSGMNAGKITLDIVGPIEDPKYWGECEDVIAKMPANVTVNVLGATSYESGLQHLVDAHFFVLPTLSENFGYVFIESLAAGTPLIISDRTMWSGVEDNGCGWALPLEDKDSWKSAIDECMSMNSETFRVMCASARSFAVDWLASSGRENAVGQVIDRAMSARVAV